MFSSIGNVASALSLLLVLSGCAAEASSSSKEGPAGEPSSRATVATTGEPSKPEIGSPADSEQKKDTATSAALPADSDSGGTTAETSIADVVNEVTLLVREGISLKELVVARGVEDKLPLDPRSSYKIGEFDRIAVWMMLANPEKIEDAVKVSILNVASGKELSEMTLEVGAQKKWRTWAFFRSVRKAGLYEAVVRASDGTVLGRASFKILPASGS